MRCPGGDLDADAVAKLPTQSDGFTLDERAVLLRAIDAHSFRTAGEQLIVQQVKVKLQMPPGDLIWLSVDVLGLSVRAANCLYNGNVKTVGEAAAKTDRDYMRMRGCGMVTLREIRNAIAELPGKLVAAK